MLSIRKFCTYSLVLLLHLLCASAQRSLTHKYTITGVEGVSCLRGYAPSLGVGTTLAVSRQKVGYTYYIKNTLDSSGTGLGVFNWGSFSAIASCDVNGDGLQDYVESNGNLYLGREAGFSSVTVPDTAFRNLTTVRTDRSNPFCTVDFNNDGLQDLLIPSNGSKRGQVILGSKNVKELHYMDIPQVSPTNTVQEVIDGWTVKGRSYMIVHHMNRLSQGKTVNTYGLYNVSIDSNTTFSSVLLSSTRELNGINDESPYDRDNTLLWFNADSSQIAFFATHDNVTDVYMIENNQLHFRRTNSSPIRWLGYLPQSAHGQNRATYIGMNNSNVLLYDTDPTQADSAYAQIDYSLGAGSTCFFIEPVADIDADSIDDVLAWYSDGRVAIYGSAVVTSVPEDSAPIGRQVQPIVLTQDASDRRTITLISQRGEQLLKRLQVYDVSGNSIVDISLHDVLLGPGTYAVRLPSDVPPGIYLIRVLFADTAAEMGIVVY